MEKSLSLMMNWIIKVPTKWNGHIVLPLIHVSTVKLLKVCVLTSLIQPTYFILTFVRTTEPSFLSSRKQLL